MFWIVFFSGLYGWDGGIYFNKLFICQRKQLTDDHMRQFDPTRIYSTSVCWIVTFDFYTDIKDLGRAVIIDVKIQPIRA